MAKVKNIYKVRVETLAGTYVDTFYGVAADAGEAEARALKVSRQYRDDVRATLVEYVGVLSW